MDFKLDISGSNFFVRLTKYDVIKTSLWRHNRISAKLVISAIISWPQQLTTPKYGIRNYLWVKINLETKWWVNQLSISFGSIVTATASLVLHFTDIGHFCAKTMTSSWRHHHACTKVYIFRNYLWSFTIMPKIVVIPCFVRILEKKNYLTYMEKPNLKG